MSKPTDWTPTARTFPPEGVVVSAMDGGGHVQQLIFENGLWWFSDRSMYIYYVPQFWQLADVGAETTASLGPCGLDDAKKWVGHPTWLPKAAKASCLAGGCEVGDRSMARGCCSPAAQHRVGDTWPGGGEHEGHVITGIKAWPLCIKTEPITNIQDGRAVPTHRHTITSGRVRCSCGAEWDSMLET